MAIKIWLMCAMFLVKRKGNTMNLRSCNGCGIVYDANKLKFPERIFHSDGSVDKEKAVWSDDVDEFVPFVYCPICGDKIRKEKQ